MESLSTENNYGNDRGDKDFQLVMRLKEIGTEQQKEYLETWKKCAKYYRGDNKYNKPGYKSDKRYNICRGVVQTYLPLMTDGQPGFNLVGQEADDYEFGTKLGKVADAWWKRNGLQKKMVKIIHNALEKGSGPLKVVWDNDLLNGQGDVNWETVKCEDLFIPGNVEDAEKLPWVIERMYKSAAELKRMYPDKAKEIKGDNSKDKDDDRKSKDPRDAVLTTPTDQYSKMQGQDTSGMLMGDDTVEVLQCWIDRKCVDEYDEIDGEDGEKQMKSKYPNGKLIVIAPNIGVKLFVGENPYEDAQHPYVNIVDTIVPGEFWGQGEVEILFDLQDALNDVVNSIIDYMKLTGNAVWFLPRSADVKTENLINTQSLAIKYSGDTSPRRDFPPALPAYYFDLVNTLMQFADNTSGAQDITQGKKPIGITADAAIQTIQEAAQTRVRLKDRNVDVGLNEAAKKTVSRFMQFYKDSRVARMTGDLNGWPSYFEFTIEDADNGKKQMSYQERTFDPNTKTFNQAATTSTTQPSKGMFDVEIVGGTSLPAKKAQMTNMAFKLFDMQLIGADRLFETIDWPKREEDAKAYNDKKAIEAQAVAVPAPGVAPVGPA